MRERRQPRPALSTARPDEVVSVMDLINPKLRSCVSGCSRYSRACLSSSPLSLHSSPPAPELPPSPFSSRRRPKPPPLFPSSLPDSKLCLLLECCRVKWETYQSLLCRTWCAVVCVVRKKLLHLPDFASPRLRSVNFPSLLSILPFLSFS